MYSTFTLFLPVYNPLSHLPFLAVLIFEKSLVIHGWLICWHVQVKIHIQSFLWMAQKESILHKTKFYKKIYGIYEVINEIWFLGVFQTFIFIREIQKDAFENFSFCHILVFLEFRNQFHIFRLQILIYLNIPGIFAIERAPNSVLLLFLQLSIASIVPKSL